MVLQSEGSRHLCCNGAMMEKLMPTNEKEEILVNVTNKKNKKK
jgi:hypothetical protein